MMTRCLVVVCLGGERERRGGREWGGAGEGGREREPASEREKEREREREGGEEGGERENLEPGEGRTAPKGVWP